MNDTNFEDSSIKNTNTIANLIQTIQTKLNSDENVIKEEPLISEEKNDTIDNKEKNLHGNFDISSLLKNLDLSKILGNTSSNDKSDNGFNISDIDPTFLLKLQKILSSMKKDDPNKDLLMSLKPFLRKSRQDKLNEYISMLSIAKAFEIFGGKGSD